MELSFVRGDRIGSITTIDKFKGIMKELIKGYPAYLYFGIFESYFRENAPAVIKFLEEDGIIRIIQSKKGEPIKYRVTANGIIFASAMVQLDYSERMNTFTKVIIFIGGTALFVAVEQLLVMLYS